MSSRYCEKQYPEFYEYLQSQYPGIKFSESCYLYYNHLTSPPGCLACGSRVSFRSIEKGYSRYCCSKCASRSKDTIDKIKQTKLDRYGDVNYNNRGQAEQTCQHRYGTSNPFASEEVKIRIKETNLQKYGVEYPSQSELIQQHRQQNTLEKYGVDHPSKLESVVNKIQATKLKLYGDANYNNRVRGEQTYRMNLIKKVPELLSITEEGDWVCTCPHPDCEECTEKCYVIDHQSLYNRKKIGCELCTKLFPVGSKHRITNIERFVMDVLDTNNISYIYNDNYTLFDNTTGKYKQLDFYLPDYKLAIECNGCLYHRTNIYSAPSKPPSYHLHKTDLCEESGIRLIQVWEDWVMNKPEIMRSMLLNKLGLTDMKVAARKCVIRKEKSPSFFQANHIQGSCPCQVSYLLIYKDEVLAGMTFGRRKGIVHSSANEEEWELLRFCVKAGYQVVGGASRLLNHFIKDYQPTTLVSFASRDISDGHLYKTLGFERIGKVQPSYWYIQPTSYKRYHRSTFSKAKLLEHGMGNPEETEFEIMDRSDYFRIYDSGTTKWVLHP